MEPLTFISLFAGIGGIDLGLERAGMRCVAQVEIDDYCTRVLAKHWPDVRRFRDVRSVGAHNLPSADVIAGGFPCQDISNAGRRTGIEGARSGLWSEYARIICELRPRYVLVENVPALLIRGMGRVLGDLAEIGYDAEWDCIPAAAVGAHHMRDRLFIVAHARREHVRRRVSWKHGAENPSRNEKEAEWSNDRIFPEMGTPIATGLRQVRRWAEPTMDRMAPRVPARVDRLKGLGNAVVPQVAELVGCAIIEHHRITA